MHGVLRRQLLRLGLDTGSAPSAEVWRSFLDRVERAYDEADKDRYTLERSLAISSRETHQLHENVSRSEASFKALVECSPDAIFVRRGPRIHYANAAMARMLGVTSAQDLVGIETSSRIVHPDDRHIVEEQLRAHERGQRINLPIRVRWIRADGASIHVEGISVPIAFDGEQGWLTTVRDVTALIRAEEERHHAEDSLRQSEDRFRALFDGSPLPTLAFDPLTLRIVEANQPAVALYGYTREELVALTMLDLKVDQHEEIKKAVDRWTGVRTHRTKSGRLIDASIVAQMSMLQGKPTVLCIIDDVTEKRRMSEQRAHTQKLEAIGRLAGGIAHDFNNILAAIVSFSALALEDLGPEHGVSGDVREIADAAQRGAALTRQLLMFSRQHPSKPELVSVNAVVSDLMTMLRRLIGTHIPIEIRLDAARDQIVVDRAQLEQVLLNLVINARDAMPNGGRLYISTRLETPEPTGGAGAQPSGAYLRLEVRDTGVGMDAATRARVFEPFFTTKELGKGTGLGLSTVFGIVTQTGGDVSVESAPGQGASFVVRLPLAPADSESPDPGQRSTHPPVDGVETILLVDDEAPLRAGLHRLLTARGYDVVEASDAREALRILEHRAGSIDLLLSDLLMPGMTGKELAGIVQERYPAIKVVLMSGYADVAGGISGVEHFVSKPFAPHQVLETLRAALTDSRAAA